MSVHSKGIASFESKLYVRSQPADSKLYETTAMKTNCMNRNNYTDSKLYEITQLTESRLYEQTHHTYLYH